MLRNFLKLIILLFLPSAAFAQCTLGTVATLWNNVDCPNRVEYVAADNSSWQQHAGLPSTLPTGETPPNGWQPPVRTTICATVQTTDFPGMNSSTYVTPTALTNALGSCANTKQVVRLAAGQYYFSGSISPHNGETLRLDQGATINFNGTAQFFGADAVINISNVTWPGPYTQGSNQFSSAASYNVNSTLITFYQCRDGYTGSNGTCTGSPVDGGGIFVCGTTACSSQGGDFLQSQTVLITGKSGTGPFTYTYSPAIYMPNWGTNGTPWFSGASVAGTSYGIEGGTISGINKSGGNSLVAFISCYACWLYGVRLLDSPNEVLQIGDNTARSLISSNYFAPIQPFVSENVVPQREGDNLIINNILQSGGAIFSQAGGAGDVIAYNLSRDGWSNSGSQNCLGSTVSSHAPGYSMALLEGNEFTTIKYDDIHGTQNLDTFFRNIVYGEDWPYTSKTCDVVALAAPAFSRIMNFHGNVLGSSSTTGYKNAGRSALLIGTPEYSSFTDTVAQQSAYIFGNYDTTTAAVRWCGNSGNTGWVATCASTSEVPTSLGGAMASFSNPVPTTETLPNSYLFSSRPSFFNVCTTWTTFPTVCQSSTSVPWPPIGPDVTGGTVYTGFNYAGHANDIPAQIAYASMPVDPAYQVSYAISSYSWAGGVETVNLGSSPSANGITGRFQISGGNCAGVYTISNSGAPTTFVQFLAPVNPGCSGGSFLYPYVLQWSANAFGQISTLAPPTNLHVIPNVQP